MRWVSGKGCGVNTRIPGFLPRLSVPTDTWLDIDIYVLEGDTETGRVVMGLTQEGAERSWYMTSRAERSTPTKIVPMVLPTCAHCKW